jgi:hypothetical protein
VLLLVALPLAYTSLTVDLLPQKALVAALALPLCALAAPGAFALALGALGLCALVFFPAAPWEIFAVAAAPATGLSLRALVEADRAFVLRLVRRAVLGVTVVALAGAAGLLPISTAAFHLPYPVLVGTLGNPNHLAAFLVLALPVLALPVPEARPGDRIEATLAVGLGVLTLLLTRSHLGALAAAVLAALLVPGPARALPLAAAALAPVVLSLDGLLRALEGRLYMLAVHARALPSVSALVGVGPGALTGRFLAWQAEHLAEHPEHLRFWTFPEHAHADLIQLPLTWGLPAAALAALVARRRLAFDPVLPPRFARAAVAALLLVAAGSGIFISPPSWAMALLLGALLFRPRAVAKPPSPRLRAAGLALGLGWLAVIALSAHAAFAHRQAIEAATVRQDLEAARVHVAHALAFPFDRARLLHLSGRIWLESGHYGEAAADLREAARLLPHPVVFRALATAERAAGQAEAARAAALAWLRVRPGDPEALAFLRN